jgi:predicted dehydrogenase
MKIGLIGCGAVAERFYAPALICLGESENLRVSVLVDPVKERLHLLGGFFPNAIRAGDLEALCQGDIDLAVVASPQHYHAEQTVGLLSRGIHVLCEKPLASTLAEAEAMVKTAAVSGMMLATGLFRRFFPVTAYVKELIVGNDMGQPLRFDWSEGGIFGWPAATPSFFQKASSPGGVFSDLGAHVIDLLLHWFGEMAEFDYKDDAMGGLEANADLKLRFESGVTGRVRLSRDTAIPNVVQIEFERGTISFQGGAAGEVTLHFKHSAMAAKADLHESGITTDDKLRLIGHPVRSYAQSFMEQIRNVCRAIRGQEDLRVPASEALPSMALIEQCYAQRKVMRMPWLSATELAGVGALAC